MIIMRFILLLLFAFSLSHAEPTKSHEEWWTKNQDLFNTFNDWLGTCSAPSRVLSRNHIKRQGYTQVLDVPCGTCTEYFGYKQDHMMIDYVGVDITKYLVQRAQAMGICALEGSIEKLPFEANSFEIVYVRHLLEHLDYYKLALLETLRVAKKEVLVVFFIPPSDTEIDRIKLNLCDGFPLYHNQYSESLLTAFLQNHPKVDRLEWERVDSEGKEILLHIYLKELTS